VSDETKNEVKELLEKGLKGLHGWQNFRPILLVTLTRRRLCSVATFFYGECD